MFRDGIGSKEFFSLALKSKSIGLVIESYIVLIRPDLLFSCIFLSIFSGKYSSSSSPEKALERMIDLSCSSSSCSDSQLITADYKYSSDISDAIFSMKLSLILRQLSKE